MSINKQIKKEMVEHGIEGALALSKASGVSYNKCLRILKGDGTVKMNDVNKVAELFGMELKLFFSGDKQ